MSDLAELWQTCVDDLKDASDVSEEREAVEPVLRGIARKLAHGDEMEAEAWADQLTGKTAFTKTRILETAQALVSEVEKDSTPDNINETPLDTVLEENLDRVVVYRSSDAHTDTDYHWYLGDDTRFVTSNGEHWAPNHMRDAVLDSTGDFPKQPVRSEQESWRRFVADLIQERGDVNEVAGPRTIATEKLANHISQRDGYPELEDALRTSGVWTPETEFDDGEPDMSSFAYVGVPNDAISSICDAQEITSRALQAELKARELLHASAETVRPKADDLPEYVRVWKLSPELATPRHIEPAVDEEPDEPAGETQEGAA